MVLTKVVKKLETYILCSELFFFKNCAVYKMWKNMVESDRL